MNNEEIKNKIAELEKSDDIKDLFLAMKLVSNTFDEDLLSDFIKKYKDKIYDLSKYLRFTPVKSRGKNVESSYLLTAND